jgi:multidrug efflux pump subunit AcrB
VVTNAIVLLGLMQHKIGAGADVRTVLIQGHRTHVCPILITAAATRAVGCSGSRAKNKPDR